VESRNEKTVAGRVGWPGGRAERGDLWPQSGTRGTKGTEEEGTLAHQAGILEIMMFAAAIRAEKAAIILEPSA
jgi:hypothetical protein